jgi:hypothetical protein
MYITIRLLTVQSLEYVCELNDACTVCLLRIAIT